MRKKRSVVVWCLNQRQYEGGETFLVPIKPSEKKKIAKVLLEEEKEEEVLCRHPMPHSSVKVVDF